MAKPGDVLYSDDDSQEVLVLQEGGTSLVEIDSFGLGVRPCYRLEYLENGFPHSGIYHDWPSAEVNFEYRAGL